MCSLFKSFEAIDNRELLSSSFIAEISFGSVFVITLFFVSNNNVLFFSGSAVECKLYEESVVDKFKSNLLLMIFWLHIINYNS